MDSVTESGMSSGRVDNTRVQDAHHSIVHDSRSAETPGSIRSSRRWFERDRRVLPVHHIGADGMGPMHFSPIRSVMVVLKKHMISPVPKYWSIRIIHPISLWK